MATVAVRTVLILGLLGTGCENFQTNRDSHRTPNESDRVIVDISGSVQRPGKYVVSNDASFRQLVEVAGGATLLRYSKRPVRLGMVFVTRSNGAKDALRTKVDGVRAGQWIHLQNGDKIFFSWSQDVDF